jgi:hypothetical protein
MGTRNDRELPAYVRPVIFGRGIGDCLASAGLVGLGGGGFGGLKAFGSEGVRERMLLVLEFLLPPPLPLPLAIEDSVLDRESMRFASLPGDFSGDDGVEEVTASNIWDRSRGG